MYSEIKFENIKNELTLQLELFTKERLIRINKSKSILKNKKKIKISTITKILNSITFGLFNFNKKKLNDIKRIRKEIYNFNKLIINTNKTIELLVIQDNLFKYSNSNYFNQINIETTIESILKVIDSDYNLLKNDLLKYLNDFYLNANSFANDLNKVFIEKEKNIFKDFFDSFEEYPLTEEQREAIITNEINNLIIAGAGSGKTSVVTAKISYILQKGYAESDEILVLAYNNKAAQELNERLVVNKINTNVKTFHSLGLNIISSMNKKESICNWCSNSKSFLNIIRNIITNIIEDKEKFILFDKYFLEYFIPYKNVKDFKTKGEYIHYIKNFDIKTLNNETVKSFEECEIANFLNLNNIHYEYEKKYRYDVSSKEYRQYEPDFYLPDYDIYIEHYGIDRDGNTAEYIDKNKYNESILWKRKIHNKHNTILIETYSYEKSEGVLLDNLYEKLKAYNVQFNKNNFDELLNKFNKKNGVIDNLSKLILTFLQHFTSKNFSKQDFDYIFEIDDLKNYENTRNRFFLNLFFEIYDRYKLLKIENDCIDFDDMIIKANELVENDKYFSRYKYLFVDEFQDISNSRKNLILNLTRQRRNSILTVVGDDWQSINKFSGSDISIIKRFDSIFGYTKTLFLNNTFRFDNNISNIASTFIMKNPTQIKKNIQTQKISMQPSVYIYNVNINKQSEAVIRILDLLEKKNIKNKKVLILGRFNFHKFLDKENMEAENNKIDYIKRFNQEYKKLNVEFMTIHSSKGLGADYVIVLGLTNGKFGFPCSIEDDPILNLVTSNDEKFDNAEERRLFYVSLTRTKEKVFLINDYISSSPFVKEILEYNNGEIHEMGISKENLIECPSCKMGYLVERVDSIGKSFYGCTNYPLCDFTEEIITCKKCNSRLKRNNEEYYAYCDLCDNDERILLCQKCTGYLIERVSNNNNKFYGCSNFSNENINCKYTKNIEI